MTKQSGLYKKKMILLFNDFFLSRVFSKLLQKLLYLLKLLRVKNAVLYLLNKGVFSLVKHVPCKECKAYPVNSDPIAELY